jgi:hypothetical protein
VTIKGIEKLWWIAYCDFVHGYQSVIQASEIRFMDPNQSLRMKMKMKMKMRTRMRLIWRSYGGMRRTSLDITMLLQSVTQR